MNHSSLWLENKTSWQLWLILINKVDFIIEACCYLYFCHFVVHCIIAHNIALFLLPIIAIKHRSSLLYAFYIKSSAALLSFYLSFFLIRQHMHRCRLCTIIIISGASLLSAVLSAAVLFNPDRYYNYISSEQSAESRSATHPLFPNSTLPPSAAVFSFSLDTHPSTHNPPLLLLLAPTF